jgi:hypothetical protein
MEESMWYSHQAAATGMVARCLTFIFQPSNWNTEGVGIGLNFSNQSAHCYGNQTLEPENAC